uniref:Roadblock/LC7 domain-containing protein n=1 Tax=candidate division WOR-3 bacterium TaxID=2052148 RepID=A0A7V0Z714_UNCW3
MLDKIPGIINYAVVNAEDGAIKEVKGSSTAPLGDLTAFFSSAAEVIKNTLSLGEINFVSLCYGANRLIIFLHNGKYIGIEVEREENPREFIARVKEQLIAPQERVKEEIKEVKPPPPPPPPPKAEIQLSRSINSKLMQINLLVEEFGSGGKKSHWIEILNQGLGIIATDILPMVGIINDKMEFKQTPPQEKEDDIVQILRTLIDFLVKKAVEEMGSSQARVKVQSVIEKMKQT